MNRVHDTVCESADAETSRARQEAGTAGENQSSHPLPHGRGSSISTDFQLDFQSASCTQMNPKSEIALDSVVLSGADHHRKPFNTKLPAGGPAGSADDCCCIVEDGKLICTETGEVLDECCCR